MAEETHDLARANLRVAEEIERQSKWVIARLVACSIHIDDHGGNRRSSVHVHLKVGLREGARLLGKHHYTVQAYMAAWNLAAADGLVIADDGLLPEDGHSAQIPDDPDGKLWEKYYRAAPERRVTNNSPDGIQHRAKTEPGYADTVMTDDLIDNVSEEKKAQVVAKFLEDSPAARQEARKSLDDRSDQFQQRAAHADEQNEARHKTSQFGEVDLVLNMSAALKALKRTLDSAEGARVSESKKEIVLGDLDDARHVLDLIENAIKGGESMDAALAQLMNEGR